MEATPADGLRFVAASGENASMLIAMTLPYGTGFIGWSIQTGKLLIVHDVAADKRHFSDVDAATGFRTRSALCVPVLSNHTVFGVLELLNPSQRFTRVDLEVVARIAETLAQRLERGGARGRNR